MNKLKSNIYLIKYVFAYFFLSSSIAENVPVFDVLGKPLNNNFTTKNYYGDGFYGSKYTYGMRKNAIVSAIVANNDTFNFPVLGINSISELGSYLDRDSVALYAENDSPPLKKWEVVRDVRVSKQFIYSKKFDLKNIKPGMIIETNTYPKFVSYIISVEANRIKTSNWLNIETKKIVMPPNIISIVINPITKVWATNFNLILPENGRAIKGVVQENGVVIRKEHSSVNGVDTVLLPQSRFDGNMAYIARSTDSGYAKIWQSGFVSIGNNISFISRNSQKNSPSISYLDDSNAKIGMEFNGKNVEHSIVWKNKNNTINALISPLGNIEKIGYKTCVVSHSTNINSNCGRYLIDIKENISINLPDEFELTDGYTLKITNISLSNHRISLSSLNKININKTNKYILPAGKNNVEVIYFNKEWIVE